MNDKRLQDAFKKLPPIPQESPQEFQKILARSRQMGSQKQPFGKLWLFLAAGVTAGMFLVISLPQSQLEHSTGEDMEISWLNEDSDRQLEPLVEDYVSMADAL